MEPAIHSDPEIMGGAPVFTGTRVPVKALIDHIKGDLPLSDFLDNYPSVTRPQILDFLESAVERPRGTAAMRVLLDECLPQALRRELKGHAVLTVQRAGWSGFKNGKLLAVAETEFDIFITVDANMPFEQQLDRFDLRFILLHPPTSKVQDILPLADPDSECDSCFEEGAGDSHSAAIE